jgi:hypothetical protein
MSSEAHAIEWLAGDAAHPTQLLYFTTPSVTADGRELVVVREDDGHPNLCVVDLQTRQLRALTANRDGTLKSYVYFRGNERRGLGKASISLDATRRSVFYLQGRALCRTELESGATRQLAELPADQVTAFTHVSADGRRWCVPTTDARALEDTPVTATKGENLVGGRRNEVITDKPAYDVDERVRREGLSSWLRIYDTESGALLASERVPQAWVTHVQFSPTNPDLILYNHEWPSDCGIRRVWLWDGKTHRALRREGAGRRRDDWACHEMWQLDGAGIIYHGKYADGRAFIGRVSPAGGDNIEIALPPEFQRYGHFTAGNRHRDWLVSDGYWHPAGEPENGLWGGEWLTRLDVNWPRRQIVWTPLARHHSAWDCQDSHPHPVYGPDDAHVYFTSNFGGFRRVGRVRVQR